MYLRQYIEKNYKQFFTCRTEAMGIAMLMVLLYHFNTSWFYAGFLGVDVFLFLSGYGLCRSYEQNPLSTFYKRRMTRILPLYIFMGIGVSFIYYFSYGKSLSFWDVICNISSLNYWGLGGMIPEWYLSFLLILYLSFPLLYFIAKKTQDILFLGLNVVNTNSKILSYARETGGGILLILGVLMVSVLLLTRGFDWYYETAIGRIPIFVLGIMCYPYNSYSKKIYFGGVLSFALFFVLSVLLYHYKYLHTYVLMYMLSPVVILLIAISLQGVVKVQAIKGFFRLLGKYSLEIYVANTLLCIYRKSPYGFFRDQSILNDAILYFATNTVLAFVLVGLNKIIHLDSNKNTVGS